jgi:hypothetical protein
MSGRSAADVKNKFYAMQRKNKRKKRKLTDASGPVRIGNTPDAANALLSISSGAGDETAEDPFLALIDETEEDRTDEDEDRLPDWVIGTKLPRKAPSTDASLDRQPGSHIANFARQSQKNAAV